MLKYVSQECAKIVFIEIYFKRRSSEEASRKGQGSYAEATSIPGWGPQVSWCWQEGWAAKTKTLFAHSCKKTKQKVKTKTKAKTKTKTSHRLNKKGCISWWRRQGRCRGRGQHRSSRQAQSDVHPEDSKHIVFIFLSFRGS